MNFKFTDIQAVIGQAQLKKLPERVKRMRAIFEFYHDRLKDLLGLRILDAQTEEWIPWFVDVFTKHRDELAFFLKQHNIQTRTVYPCIHDTEPYKEQGDFPVSHTVATNGLFLPSHLMLTDIQLEYICSIIRMYFL